MRSLHLKLFRVLIIAHRSQPGFGCRLSDHIAVHAGLGLPGEIGLELHRSPPSFQDLPTPKSDIPLRIKECREGGV